MSDEDREGDPFESLEESVGDREGDPFDQLDAGEETAANRSEGPEQAPDESVRTDPESQSEPNFGAEPTSSRDEEFESGQFVSERESPADTVESPADSDGSGMNFEVGQRESPEPGEGPTFAGTGDREGDPFGSVDSAFAEMDVEQIDPDTVWQELTSAQSRGSVGDARKRTYAEVSKHSYCEQCEHFSEPPDVHCGHEGTEIVEFLDMETVRVVDCPVVAERKKLEDDSHDGKD